MLRDASSIAAEDVLDLSTSGIAWLTVWSAFEVSYKT